MSATYMFLNLIFAFSLIKVLFPYINYEHISTKSKLITRIKKSVFPGVTTTCYLTLSKSYYNHKGGRLYCASNSLEFDRDGYDLGDEMDGKE